MTTGRINQVTTVTHTDATPTVKDGGKGPLCRRGRGPVGNRDFRSTPPVGCGRGIARSVFLCGWPSGQTVGKGWGSHPPAVVVPRRPRGARPGSSRGGKKPDAGPDGTFDCPVGGSIKPTRSTARRRHGCASVAGRGENASEASWEGLPD